MGKKSTRNAALTAVESARNAAADAKKLRKSLPAPQAKKLKPLVNDALDASDISEKKIFRHPKRVTKSATAAAEALEKETARLRDKLARKQSSPQEKVKKTKSKNPQLDTTSAPEESVPETVPTPVPTVSPAADLATLTVVELRQRAKAAGLTGYSRLSKAQLVQRLSA